MARRRNSNARDKRQQTQTLVTTHLLSRLPALEQQVVKLRFGIEGGHPSTPASVAAHLGISVGEVAELEARALERLTEISDRDSIAKLIAA